jgi:hypothetical protein
MNILYYISLHNLTFDKFPHNLQTYATFGVINAFTEVVHALRERNKADNAVAVARRSAFTETNSGLLDASANPFVNSTSWK